MAFKHEGGCASVATFQTQTENESLQVLERKLDSAICLPVYRSHRDGVAASGSGPELALHRGERQPLFLGSVPDDKLPKDATAGRLLKVGGGPGGWRARNTYSQQFDRTTADMLCPPALDIVTGALPEHAAVQLFGAYTAVAWHASLICSCSCDPLH